jgi:hypothetical protein
MTQSSAMKPGHVSCLLLFVLLFSTAFLLPALLFPASAA